jgi:hypothetical protein
MEFRVYFKATNGYAVDLENWQVGTRGLGQIRAESGASELALERIDGYIGARKRDVEITIFEDIARRSKMFEVTNLTTVSCPKGFLNKFTELKTKTERNTQTGEITYAMLIYKPDTEKIIAAWEAAGFPLEWKGGEK